MSNEKEESLSSVIHRATLNTLYRADVFCRKSERNAKLAVKKIQLRQVKKSFGIDYMTLLEKEATPEQLDECLRNGHEKIDLIHKEMRTLRAEKTSLDDLLRHKLIHKSDEDTEEHNETSASTNENHQDGKNPAKTNVKSDKEPEVVVPSFSASTIENHQDGKNPAETNVVKSDNEPQVVVPSSQGDEETGEEVVESAPTFNDDDEEFIVLPPPSAADGNMDK